MGCILVMALVALALLVKSGLLELIISLRRCKWYESVLSRLNIGERLFDIGSGTAGALASQGSVERILNNNLVVICIDSSASHVRHAMAALYGPVVLKKALKNKVILHHKNVYDVDLQRLFRGEAEFNAVCFSAPLAGLSDPAAALRIAGKLLKEGGLIYVPHVASEKQKGLSAFLLKLLRQAPIANVREIVSEAGMEVLDDLPAFGGAEKKNSLARMLVLRQSSAAARVFGKEAKGEVRSRRAVEAKI